MSDTLTIEKTVHFHARRRGRKELRSGAEPSAPVPSGPRLPHIARLMALAIACEALVQSGEIKDYAELARLAHLTRARISQIIDTAR